MIRNLVSAALVFAALGASASPQTLWSVGISDKSGKEFAAFQNHGEYTSASIARPFTIGTNLAHEWPYIHPGPADKWAGSRVHRLAISFDLSPVPQGTCAIVIDLVDVHYGGCDLRASLNGVEANTHLDPGSGDHTLTSESGARPRTIRIPFHPDLLKTGKNELVLSVAKGSWLLYDAVRIETEESVAPQRFEASAPKQSPLFERTKTGARPTMYLPVKNYGRPAKASVITSTGGKQITLQADLPFGETVLVVPIAQIKEPTPVGFTLTAEGAEITTTAVAMPQRKWKIFIAPSSHTDIGYTHQQPEVFKRHNDNLDTAMEMCRRNPLFKWNLEVSWQWQNYVQSQPEEKITKALSLIRGGRVGVHGAYLNMLTGLMCDEAMNRYAYQSAAMRREVGVDISAAILTDVPSATWAVVPAFASSGIRYFAEGINSDRGPTLKISKIRDPFYWEGPDGSRLLTFFTNSYGQSLWLAHATRLEQMQEHVTNLVRAHDRADYPYDAIYLFGAFFDNQELDRRYGSMLAKWKEKWAYPELIISTSPEFFRYIERNYGEHIPVRRGDFGGYWEDGAASTAYETAQLMESQRRIVAAEPLAALAKQAGANTTNLTGFDKAWENILFYAEHTWGAHNSIRDPGDAWVQQQWNFKANYAHEADNQTTQLLESSLLALADVLPAGLQAVNCFSWPRCGMLEVPAGTAGIPTQQLDGKTYSYVGEVPAFGNRAVVHAAAARADDPAESADSALANRYYEMKTSPERGIVSIIDRDTGSELLDPASPYSFGQLLYACGGEDTKMVHERSEKLPVIVHNDSSWQRDPLNARFDELLLTPARIKSVEMLPDGPIWSEIVVTGEAPSMPDVRTHVRLHRNEKRISVDVHITSKTEIHRKEAVYVTFPFACEKPEWRLGMTNSVVRPDRDLAPGSCNEWYSVQDFVSCRNPADGCEVVLAPLDAPLVCLSLPNTGRWPVRPELTTATIFSYAMNNYWHTNYKAGQGGDFRFRYELTSLGDATSNGDRIRFARAAATPLMTVMGKSEKTSPRQTIDVPAQETLTHLKLSQDGKGIIARLRNPEETTVTATIKADKGKVSMADLVEQATGAPQRATLDIELRPQQVRTVRIE